MSKPLDPHLPIHTLLKQAGITQSISSITPTNLGGNNRIYQVITTSGTFAAKQYFRHQADQRDRLASEYAFIEYAYGVATDFVPRPYACDHELGWALYEYIDGQHISADAVSELEIDQAISFFKALNSPDSNQKRLSLPNSSEACFTVEEHLNLVGGRIKRLKEQLTDPKEEDRAAANFIAELDVCWQQLSSEVSRFASEKNLLSFPLDPQQRCASPSDFGFHNALLQANGQIRFIDFEYAGLDDPAKMTGDFFSQLAVPVPSKYFERFVTGCMQCFPEAEALIVRAEWLRRVYQVKWCCIAMNVFLPVNLARRKFANPGLDETHIKQSQLNKASQLLNTLQQEMKNGIH